MLKGKLKITSAVVLAAAASIALLVWWLIPSSGGGGGATVSAQEIVEDACAFENLASYDFTGESTLRTSTGWGLQPDSPRRAASTGTIRIS